MATKANLITAINTQLTAIITQAKVRLASVLVVDEIYPSKIVDNETTTTVLTNDVVGLEYIITLWKQGNNVNVSGVITNNTAGILSNIDLISITNAEYQPDATALNPFRFYGSDILFQVTNTNKIKIIDSLGVGNSVSFNFNYKSND